MTLPTVACPACGRTFKNDHGRGGHLTTLNDAAHESYRAAHGMPAKTPRATQAANRGRPSANPASSPSRRDPPTQAAQAPPSEVRLAPPGLAQPSNPAQPPTLPGSPSAPQAARVESSPAPPSDNASAFMRQAVDDFMRQAEASRQATPTKPKARKTKETTEAPPAKVNDAAGVLAGAGIAAGLLGLMGVVKSLKGAKAAKAPEPQAPPATWGTEPVAPPQDLPDWISALNGGAPMTGGLRPRQKREWWYL